MRPPRGLSMSAMRGKATDSENGRIRSTELFALTQPEYQPQLTPL